MSEPKTKQILLVDDDDHLLTTLTDFLTFEGFTVECARSGEEGLRKLEKISPDLIVLDISMPGIGGIGFLRRITSASGKPKHPVLVLTAKSTMKEFFATVEVDGFLPKPCSEDALLRMIREILMRHASDKSTASPGGRTVLLGEDKTVPMEDIVRTFSSNGFNVEVVSNGPELLKQAAVVKPDIIVMKNQLPRMKGALVASLVAAMPSTKGIPVVLYTDRAALDGGRSNQVPDNVQDVVPTAKAERLLDSVQKILKD